MDAGADVRLTLALRRAVDGRIEGTVMAAGEADRTFAGMIELVALLEDHLDNPARPAGGLSAASGV
jgi:hypothetical protein